MGGGHHFGPFPKFPRFLVWKASLRLTNVLRLHLYGNKTSLNCVTNNSPQCLVSLGLGVTCVKTDLQLGHICGNSSKWDMKMVVISMFVFFFAVTAAQKTPKISFISGPEVVTDLGKFWWLEKQMQRLWSWVFRTECWPCMQGWEWNGVSCQLGQDKGWEEGRLWLLSSIYREDTYDSGPEI